MNEFVKQVEISLNKKIPATHIPYWLGMLGGFGFDMLSKLTGEKFSVSSVRVKKFCLPRREVRPCRGATTQFDSTAAHSSGFKAPFTLSEGLHCTLEYEFLNQGKEKGSN